MPILEFKKEIIMLGFFIFGIIVSVTGGVMVGTQLSLIWQACILVIGWLLLSKATAEMELAGLPWLMLGMLFTIGVLIGDVSYMIQTGWEGLTFPPNPFKV